MRYNTFPRTVAFSAIAALGWVPWLILTAPIVGTWNARALYLIAVLTLYVAGIAGFPAMRLRVALATGLAGVGVALVSASTTELVVGLVLVLGVARSAYLYSTAATQAVIREVILLSSGLLLARVLAASPGSTGLALWGFLLVQSFFFLLPVTEARAASKRYPDPFEEAHRRALAILDGDPHVTRS
jgi:hypothetical protein